MDMIIMVIGAIAFFSGYAVNMGVLTLVGLVVMIVDGTYIMYTNRV